MCTNLKVEKQTSIKIKKKVSLKSLFQTLGRQNLGNCIMNEFGHSLKNL